MLTSVCSLQLLQQEPRRDFSAPPRGLLHVRADAVVGPHAGRADEIQLVVQAGQVHGQVQVLLVHSPVADPAAAVAQALRVLQVKGQRAASAGWAEGMRALAPARWRCGREAGRPVGLGEEGGRVGLWVITVVVWRWRRGGSRQSQGAGGQHGGKLWFLLFPLFRLLPPAAVILDEGEGDVRGEETLDQTQNAKLIQIKVAESRLDGETGVPAAYINTAQRRWSVG